MANRGGKIGEHSFQAVLDRRDPGMPVSATYNWHPMRILVTADLHYDIARSRASAEQAAMEICAAGGDAMVLVGDTAGAELGPMRDCLALFSGFKGLKLIVPGNHCLWRRAGEDSLERYERVLPDLAKQEGFVLLDHQPTILGGVGLIGSIGWYDYSFRQRSLGIDEEFYEAKVAPGAAAYYEEYRELYERHRDRLTPDQLAIGVRWMDGLYIRLPFGDKEFTRRLCEKLEGQLEALSRSADRIVAFLHHLPFAELVPRDRPTRFAFAAAFMGAPCFGEALLACPKVSHVYCGHSHWTDERKIGHLTVTNIGSTYTHKRMAVLEL
jgi:predicted phosphohydrolase